MPNPTMTESTTNTTTAPSSSELPDSARMEWLWSEYEKQMEEMKQYQEEGFVLKTRLLTSPTRNSPQFPILTPSQQTTKLKFFINLCHDPSISMPSMQFNHETGEEQLRMPISVGPVSMENEKDGVTECLVCDIILNPDSITKAQKEKEFRSFISSFVMSKLEEKYKIVLDKEEMKFPKMKYKSEQIGVSVQPPPQHIRRPKTAHVEEEKDNSDDQDKDNTKERLEERRKQAELARIEALKALEERESGLTMSGTGKKPKVSAGGAAGEVFLTEEQAEASAAAGNSADDLDSITSKPETAKIEVIADEPAPATSTAASTPSTTLPSHTISYLRSVDSTTFVPYTDWDLSLGDPACIVLQITLPLVNKSSVECQVDVRSDGVDVTSVKEFEEKHKYRLHTQFPFFISEEQSSCSFAKKTHLMTLRLPVIGRREIELDEEVQETTAKQATTEPAVDWQDRLGLTNTLMWQSVSQD